MNFRAGVRLFRNADLEFRIEGKAINKIELERRTKEFSLILVRFLESLPKNYLGEALA